MGAAFPSLLTAANASARGPDWGLPAPHCDRLSSREVDVWVVPLPVPAQVEASLAATLSADERERAGRFIGADKRQQFIAGRGLLRKLLGTYLGLPPAQVQLSTQGHGKPALADAPALSFNLSHTDGLLLIALARGMDIGVDVERVRPVESAPSLASRYFSARECAAMEAGPQGFLRLWTCRESVVKAFGSGISAGWEDLHIVERSRAEADAVCQDRTCHVQMFTPQPGYVAALAAVADGFRMRTRRLLDFTPHSH